VPIPVVCPECGAKMIAPDSTLGTRTECPECGEAMTVRSVNDAERAAAGDAGPLHPGWRKVAFGYRLLGFALVALVLGVAATTAVTVGTWAVYEYNQEVSDDTPRMVSGGAVAAISVLCVVVLALVGLLSLSGMPRDEAGGRGRALAVVMLALGFVPGLNWLPPLLLPVFSAGVGAALGDRRLTQSGWDLYTWYGTAGFMVPILYYGGVFVGVTLGRPIVGFIAGGVLAVVGLLASYMVWSTLAGFRRGIEVAIRERGTRG
jgi:hypothetical protein